MKFSAEQHLAVAKLLRDKAKSLGGMERAQAIQRSNEVLVLAVLAAKDRGGLSLSGFDREACEPDWTILNEQFRRLAPAPVQPSQDDRHTQVRQLIKHLYDIPKQMVTSIVFDQSVYVKEAIKTVLHEGFLGLILTSLMILIFLGSFRATSAVH